VSGFGEACQEGPRENTRATQELTWGGRALMASKLSPANWHAVITLAGT